MSIHEQHVHHLAKRLHQAHGKIDELRAKWSGVANAALSTAEVSAGAFLGGVLEGKTSGGALFDRLPYNLLGGVALLAAGHTVLADTDYADHVNNVGNGFIAGYVASKGYAFGERWRDTGKILGGGGGSPAQLPGPVVQGELSPEAVHRMAAVMQGAVG